MTAPQNFYPSETPSFNDLVLADHLLKMLDNLGFHTPSPIQAQTIPVLMQGADVIAQAQTGTGKTLAFALPILHNLPTNVNYCYALILAPTRELAIQVGEQFKKLNVTLNVATLCGGQDYSTQLRQLRTGAAIVVGTPGRVLDHLARGTLDLANLNTFILDEADEMLRMGFIEDVETIIAKLPAKRQIAFFSATMPSRIRQIASSYLNQPLNIVIPAPTATVKNTQQYFTIVAESQKPVALARLLAVEDYDGLIIFVRTKTKTEDLAANLQQQNLRVTALHGDVTQAVRERIIMQFKRGSIDILVATDVAARGLDVDRVTHVINYDIPGNTDTYIHRIGRTGRAGRSGKTILLATPKEGRFVSSIERYTKQQLIKLPVPGNDMIQKERSKKFVDNIIKNLENSNATHYKQLIDNILQKEELSAEKIAAVLAALLDKGQIYQNLPDIAMENPAISKLKLRKAEQSYGKQMHQKGSKTKSTLNFKDSSSFKQRFGRSQQEGSRSQPESLRSQQEGFRSQQEGLFRLDVGKMHGAKPKNIIGALANEGGLESRVINGLKIHDYFSTVRLPQGMPKQVVQGLNKARVCGRQLNLTPVETF